MQPGVRSHRSMDDGCAQKTSNSLHLISLAQQQHDPGQCSMKGTRDALARSLSHTLESLVHVRWRRNMKPLFRCLCFGTTDCKVRSLSGHGDE